MLANSVLTTMYITIIIVVNTYTRYIDMYHCKILWSFQPLQWLLQLHITATVVTTCGKKFWESYIHGCGLISIGKECGKPCGKYRNQGDCIMKDAVISGTVISGSYTEKQKQKMHYDTNYLLCNYHYWKGHAYL